MRPGDRKLPGKPYPRKGSKITKDLIIPRESLKKYFEILELKPDAGYLDVKNAYLRLKKLYSSDSTIISPIAHEFSRRKNREILHKLERAYTKLSALMEYEKSQSRQSATPEGKDSPSQKIEPPSFSGQTLKEVRTTLGIQLFNLSLDTKIRKEILQNIEDENFRQLPHEAYLSAHLANYAKYLGLNPKKVTRDYLIRYWAWKQKTKRADKS